MSSSLYAMGGSATLLSLIHYTKNHLFFPQHRQHAIGTLRASKTKTDKRITLLFFVWFTRMLALALASTNHSLQTLPPCPLSRRIRHFTNREE